MLLFPEGKGSYAGEWRDGERTGLGTFTLPGGEYYEGEFSRGKRHGRGRYVWPTGARFEGEFEGDAPTKGTLHKLDGAAIELDLR